MDLSIGRWDADVKHWLVIMLQKSSLSKAVGSDTLDIAWEEYQCLFRYRLHLGSEFTSFRRFVSRRHVAGYLVAEICGCPPLSPKFSNDEGRTHWY